MQNDEPVTVQDLPSTESSEPAVITSVVVAVGTLIVNGGLFAIPLTVDQRMISIIAVNLLAPIVAGLIIRFKVVSPKTYDQVSSYFKLLLAEKDAALTAAVEQGKNQVSVVSAIQDLLPTLLPQLGGTIGAAVASSTILATQQLAPVPPQAPSAPPSPPQEPELPQGYPSAQGWPYAPQAPAQPLPRQSESRHEQRPAPTGPDYDPRRQQSAQPEGFYDYSPRSRPPMPRGYATQQ